MSLKHVEQLDKAQAELDAVLVHMARLLNSARCNGSAAAAAQASKLRAELPGRMERYHESLDEIDDEIQLAQWTLRRHLAICREKLGPTQNPPAMHILPHDSGPPVSEDVTQDPKPDELDPQGPTTSETDTAIPEPAPFAAAHSLPLPTHKLFDAATAQDTDPGPITSDEKPTAAKDANDTKPAEPQLKVETSKEPPVGDADADQKPPDTGVTSTNADLDSLFNDGTDTASGGASGENNDFDFDANGAEGMDFTDVFGDNDNSNNDVDHGALLRGVHDYANAGPDNGMNTDSGMNIFDDFTNADAPAAGGDGGGQVIDFMDFDFDQFTTDTNSNNNSNNNADDDVFKFD